MTTDRSKVSDAARILAEQVRQAGSNVINLALAALVEGVDALKSETSRQSDLLEDGSKTMLELQTRVVTLEEAKKVSDYFRRTVQIGGGILGTIFLVLGAAVSGHIWYLANLNQEAIHDLAVKAAWEVVKQNQSTTKNP